MPQAEVTKAKNGLEARFVLGQDSNFYQGMLLGQYEIAGDWRRIDDYVPSVRAVTAEDLRRVAAQYLTATNRTVATLDPLPPAAGRPLFPVPCSLFPRPSIPHRIHIRLPRKRPERIARIPVPLQQPPQPPEGEAQRPLPQERVRVQPREPAHRAPLRAGERLGDQLR